MVRRPAWRRLMAGMVLAGGAIWIGKTAGQTSQPVEQLPRAVRVAAATAEKEARRKLPKMREEMGEEFQLEFGLQFYSRAVDYRDERSPAYLVGYTLGTVPGNGLLPIYRTMLVDGRGAKLVETDEGGLTGFALKIRHKMEAAIISGDEGRPHHGYVTVVTLEKKPRVVLNYAAPDPWMWESTLYFADSSRGEKMMETDREILVERIVRDPETKTKWTEHVRLTYSDSTGVFEESARMSKDLFEKMLSYYGGKNNIPKITQSCSYEDAWDNQLKVVPGPGEK